MAGWGTYNSLAHGGAGRGRLSWVYHKLVICVFVQWNRQGDLVTITDKQDVAAALTEVVEAAERAAPAAHAAQRMALQHLVALTPLRLHLVRVSSEVCRLLPCALSARAFCSSSSSSSADDVRGSFAFSQRRERQIETGVHIRKRARC